MQRAVGGAGTGTVFERQFLPSVNAALRRCCGSVRHLLPQGVAH